MKIFCFKTFPLLTCSITLRNWSQCWFSSTSSTSTLAFPSILSLTKLQSLLIENLVDGDADKSWIKLFSKLWEFPFHNLLAPITLWTVFSLVLQLSQIQLKMCFCKEISLPIFCCRPKMFLCKTDPRSKSLRHQSPSIGNGSPGIDQILKKRWTSCSFVCLFKRNREDILDILKLRIKLYKREHWFHNLNLKLAQLMSNIRIQKTTWIAWPC